jgi:hypothetical protein
VISVVLLFSVDKNDACCRQRTFAERDAKIAAGRDRCARPSRRAKITP